MDLIYDVDAVPSHLRRNLHLIHKPLDVVHTVVGRRVKLVNAIRPPLLKRDTRLALAARLHIL